MSNWAEGCRPATRPTDSPRMQSPAPKCHDPVIKCRGMTFQLGRFWWLVLGVLAVASSAGAQDRVAQQIALLQKSTDFRVRTQAALALGSSKDARAVPALCKSLDDANTTVRIASAAGLGRLNLGGSDCLKRRLGKEQSTSVKGSIDRALAQLGPSGPVIDAKTRFYVALGNTAHETGRTDVDALVRRGAAKAAAAAAGFALAPNGETVDAARGVLAAHGHVKGYYLAPKLTLTYSGSRLNIKLSVAMLSYPDKNVIGQFTRTAASPTSERDPALEAELVTYVAEAAMKQFSEIAPTL